MVPARRNIYRPINLREIQKKTAVRGLFVSLGLGAYVEMLVEFPERQVSNPIGIRVVNTPPPALKSGG